MEEKFEIPFQPIKVVLLIANGGLFRGRTVFRVERRLTFLRDDSETYLERSRGHQLVTDRSVTDRQPVIFTPILYALVTRESPAFGRIVVTSGSVT